MQRNNLSYLQVLRLLPLWAMRAPGTRMTRPIKQLRPLSGCVRKGAGACARGEKAPRGGCRCRRYVSLGEILPAILSHGVPFVQRRAPAAAERPQCINIQKRIGVIIVLHKIIPAVLRPTGLRGTVFLAFYEKASVSGTKKRMEKAGAPKASLRCSSENRPPMHKAAHPR